MSENDVADDNLVFPLTTTWEETLKQCHLELYSWPQLLERKFYGAPLRRDANTWELVAQETDSSPNDQGCSFRVLQWNVLAEALRKDVLDSSAIRVMQWEHRRWRILEEIATARPDILCLQEVDHFKFLKTTLTSLGFKGVFLGKGNSPCLKYDANNGPDGCAIFWKDELWTQISINERILEINACKSNQVALMAVLERKNINDRPQNNEGNSENKMVAVVTTHLKSDHEGPHESERLEQGKDLLKWIVEGIPSACPLVLTGDFNAEPLEPVYDFVLSEQRLKLRSSYAAPGHSLPKHNTTDGDHAIRVSPDILEPPRTTKRHRKDDEKSRAIDYIFYSKNSLVLEKVLDFPRDDIDIPSNKYPSDHFSLVTDFGFSPAVNE